MWVYKVTRNRVKVKNIPENMENSGLKEVFPRKLPDMQKIILSDLTYRISETSDTWAFLPRFPDNLTMKRTRQMKGSRGKTYSPMVQVFSPEIQMQEAKYYIVL
jgi:hypothetical protein